MEYKYTCDEIISGLLDMKLLTLPGEGCSPAYTRTDFTDDPHKAFHFRTDFEIIPM